MPQLTLAQFTDIFDKGLAFGESIASVTETQVDDGLLKALNVARNTPVIWDWIAGKLASDDLPEGGFAISQTPAEVVQAFSDAGVDAPQAQRVLGGLLGGGQLIDKLVSVLLPILAKQLIPFLLENFEELLPQLLEWIDKKMMPKPEAA